jgi:hypothetical protein
VCPVKIWTKNNENQTNPCIRFPGSFIPENSVAKNLMEINSMDASGLKMFNNVSYYVKEP